MAYGLSAGGARNIVRPLRPPPPVRITRAAPKTGAAMAGQVPPTEAKLWGSLPIEDVEGHEPDPAYDVRPIEGLGAPPVRSEMLGVIRSEGDFATERFQRARFARRDREQLRVLGPDGERAERGGEPGAIPSAPAVAGFNLGGMLPFLAIGALLLLVRR